MIILKKIQNSDVSSEWVSWLNNKKINKYSNQRFLKHSVKTQKEFIRKKIKDKSSRMFAIFYLKQHIGIIELTKIDNVHKNCIVSFMIGNNKYWNKGLASEALRQILDIGFKTLKLKKITSSTYADNIGSERVMLKNGFKVEGLIKNFYKYGNKRMDKKLLGISDKEYLKRNK